MLKEKKNKHVKQKADIDQMENGKKTGNMEK